MNQEPKFHEWLKMYSDALTRAEMAEAALEAARRSWFGNPSFEKAVMAGLDAAARIASRGPR